MYHYIAKVLGEMLCKDNDEKCTLITYGLEIMISSVVTLLILSFIGAYFHCIRETILFMILYCPLRQYAGGYHASSYTRCNMFMITAFCVFIFMWKNTMIYIRYGQLTILYTLTIVFIWFHVPVPTANKQLEEYEFHKYRVKSQRILILEMVIYAIGLLLKKKWVLYVGLSAVCLISILLLSGIRKEIEVRRTLWYR